MSDGSREGGTAAHRRGIFAASLRPHAYGSGRSHDAFYNGPGTLFVSITGVPAAQGENADVYSISYGVIAPGVSAKVIAGMNVQNVVCP